MTQGFQRSDLIIVAGRSGMGKSAFACNVARNMATLHGLPVLIFSLEMSSDQVISRYLSADSRISTGRLLSGKVASQEWEPLGHAASVISVLPIYVEDTFDISVAQMKAKARRLHVEQGGLGAIVVDYLQLMEGTGDNRVQELSRITRKLKGMARELNVPVFALSQLNRAVEGRSNKRPMMSDLRESGSIEQDADLILMLYRDEYYDPNTVDRGIAEIIIAKHRNGPTGTVKLLFEGESCTFRNLRQLN
jgi:replicative DNA helicase